MKINHVDDFHYFHNSLATMFAIFIVLMMKLVHFNNVDDSEVFDHFYYVDDFEYVSE